MDANLLAHDLRGQFDAGHESNFTVVALDSGVEWPSDKSKSSFKSRPGAPEFLCYPGNIFIKFNFFLPSLPIVCLMELLYGAY